MKKIIILLVVISGLGVSGCATNNQKTKTDENKAVPEVLLSFIKIKKLYMCHYFFAVGAQEAKGEHKEKLRRISLSLKYKATKLAADIGGPDLIKRVSHNSKIGFRKFMNKTSEINDASERNKALNTFSRSCAVTAGAKLKRK